MARMGTVLGALSLSRSKNTPPLLVFQPSPVQQNSPCFKLLSLSVSKSFSPRSLFFLFSSVFRPPSPSSQRSWVLFIEPRAWLFTVLMGSSRLVGHWARLPRFGPSPGFPASAQRVVGHCVRSVGSRREREPGKKFKQKAPFFFSSPLHVRGKKKGEQCRIIAAPPFTRLFQFGP